MQLQQHLAALERVLKKRASNPDFPIKVKSTYYTSGNTTWDIVKKPFLGFGASDIPAINGYLAFIIGETLKRSSDPNILNALTRCDRLLEIINKKHKHRLIRINLTTDIILAGAVTAGPSGAGAGSSPATPTEFAAPHIKYTWYGKLHRWWKRRQGVEEAALPTTGRRFYYSEHQQKTYNHPGEALRIFFNTQRERLKSILLWFAYPMRKYFRLQESDEDIYAAEAENPIVRYPATYPNNSENFQLQSSWLGHATVLLTVPSSNIKRPMHILFDPVEGDLNKLLYPRRTRPGWKLEDAPNI